MHAVCEQHKVQSSWPGWYRRIKSLFQVGSARQLTSVEYERFHVPGTCNGVTSF